MIVYMDHKNFVNEVIDDVCVCEIMDGVYCVFDCIVVVEE